MSSANSNEVESSQKFLSAMRESLGLRIADLFESPEHINKELSLNGWVRTKRSLKDLCFLEINDGSCQNNLQVLALEPHLEGSLLDEETWTLIQSAHNGSSIQVAGILKKSDHQGQTLELHAKKFQLYGPAPQDSYPLQKKQHSFEFLRDQAHLRPRTNTFGAVTRVRNHLARSIHTFYQNLGYVWVHTPLITASDCEGAGQMFQVTTLDLEKIAQNPASALDYKNDFFAQKSHLTVSGQLNGETYASALGRIYTFGPTFRAENSNTARHLAEFWMVEPETAFLDLHGNMELAENFIKYLLSSLLKNCPQELDFFENRIQKGLIENLSTVIETDFHRLDYTQAIEILEKAKKDFEYPVHWGDDLQSEHERYLSEEYFQAPLIITAYPKDIKAFYMKQNEDGKTVKAMDVIVPRLGEIIGGSERENDLETLLKRMSQLKLDPEAYWWYLDLRRFGSVVHSGFGLGFERLVQYATGMQNIRDVIPFPRTPRNAQF